MGELFSAGRAYRSGESLTNAGVNGHSQACWQRIDPIDKIWVSEANGFTAPQS